MGTENLKETEGQEYFSCPLLDLLLLLSYNELEVIELTIREKRKSLGMTQEAIAKAVGVSLLSYQLWERGVTSPNEENRKKLCAALDLEITELGE